MQRRSGDLQEVPDTNDSSFGVLQNRRGRGWSALCDVTPQLRLLQCGNSAAFVSTASGNRQKRHP